MSFSEKDLKSLGREFKDEMKRLTALAIEMNAVQKRLRSLRKQIDNQVREARRAQE